MKPATSGIDVRDLSPRATSLLEAALALPVEDRIELACRLEESLEGFASSEIEAAWDKEVAERIRKADSGGPPSIPAEEVYRQLRADYGVLADSIPSRGG